MAKAKHYSYRVDHDVGFAPHIQGRLCTLRGCKKTTIEKWAKAGSWVVGIGGNRTGKADMLIYAMKVQETPSYSEFSERHPEQAAYLAQKLADKQILADTPVLVSKHFYYFGDQAKPVPPNLSRVIHRARGCKMLPDNVIAGFAEWIETHYKPGKHGKPCNLRQRCKRCSGDLKVARAPSAVRHGGWLPNSPGEQLSLFRGSGSNQDGRYF